MQILNPVINSPNSIEIIRAINQKSSRKNSIDGKLINFHQPNVSK